MPTPTMQALYARRTPLLIGVIVLFAAALWLLGTHIYRYYPHHQTPGYMQLKSRYGELIAPATGLAGMMGVEPTHIFSYITATLVLLAIYFAAMIGFARFGRDWRDAIFAEGRLPLRMALSASLMTAFVTVATIATTAELLGMWSDLNHRGTTVAGLIIYRTFYVALVILLVAWAAWFIVLRPMAPKRDRFIKMIVITYMLFVAAGGLTVVAAWLQIYHEPVRDVGVYSGAYTGTGVGFAVMLWTLVPSLVTIYRSEYYRRARNGLCIRCGYDVRTGDSKTCPECGHPVSLKYVRKMKKLSAD